MVRSLFIGLFVSVLTLSAVGGALADNGGHGSIYYSPSTHRIGWAKNLDNDQTANDVAFEMCRGGGQYSNQANSALNNNQAGVNASNFTHPSLLDSASDCRRIIKFDSNDDHVCGGFGFDPQSGRFSNGYRESNATAVGQDLSSWTYGLILCNNDDPIRDAAPHDTQPQVNNQNQTIQQGGSSQIFLTGELSANQPELQRSVASPCYGRDMVAGIDRAGGVNRLEIAYIGSDGKVYRCIRDRSTANGWQGPFSTNGYAKDLAMGTNSNGSLEIFVTGGNGEIYHMYQDGTGNRAWSRWFNMGYFGRGLATAVDSNGNMELFFTGNDGNIYRAVQDSQMNSGWSNAQSIGGSGSGIAVGKNADGRLEIFYTEPSGAIATNYQTFGGGWSGSHEVGGFGTGIAVGSDQDGRIEFFYTDSSGNIYNNYQTAPNHAFAGPHEFGGSGSSIRVASNADGRLAIFYINGGQLYYRTQVIANHGWGSPEALSVSANTLAVCVVPPDGRIAVFFALADTGSNGSPL